MMRAVRKLRYFVVLLLATFLFPPAALAWNPAGHMAIASIAYDQLTPARRQALVTLLHEHPRFGQDFKSSMPTDLTSEQQDRWIFMRASLWPDITRSIQGPDQQVYNRPAWHYVDLPVYLDEKAREKIHVPPFEFDYHKATSELSMNVVQALKKAVDDLNNPATPRSRQAVALCWVLHLASDIHQPLHGAALFSAERFRGIPIGDRGGNDIHVKENEGLLATSNNPNLHALWDNILGTDDSYDAVMKLAQQLTTEHPMSSLSTQLSHTAPEDWARESNDAARKVVYTPEIRAVVEAGEAQPHKPLAVVEITDDYLKAGRPVAQTRAALAAYRTAALLQ
jgi:hypothetical protein